MTEEQATPFERAMQAAVIGQRVTLQSGYGYHYGQDFGRLGADVTGVVEARVGDKVYIRFDADSEMGRKVRGHRAVFPVMAIQTEG